MVNVTSRPVQCSNVRSQHQYKYRTYSGIDPDNLYASGRVSDLSPAEPLATLRKRKLLSQRDLAARAGVALSTIYLLEKGNTARVTFKVMRAVSEALGTPPERIAEFRRVIDER